MSGWTFRSISRRFAPAMVAMGVVAIGGWFLAPTERFGQDRLVAHWTAKASSSDRSTALDAIRQLDKLGASGFVGLAAAIGADDPKIAHSAEERILARIQSWGRPAKTKESTAEHDVRAAAALARALADRAEDYGPLARELAGRIALRLLLTTGKMAADGADRASCVADCDRLLSSVVVESASDILRGTSRLADQRDEIRPGGLIRRPGPLAKRTGHAFLDARPFPAVVSTEIVDGAPPPDAHEAVADVRQPSRRQPPNRSPQEATGGSPSGSGARNRFEADWRPYRGRRRARTEPTSAANPSRGLPTGSAPARIHAMFRSLSVVELFPLLRSGDPAIARATESELLSRGFSEIEVGVANRVYSPDPVERARLVEQLPTMPGVAAQRWLFLLAADEQADIRLNALTLLATNADPSTVRRIRQIALRDRDRRIVALGERLAGLDLENDRRRR